jgi:hypothetical protein
MGTSFERTKNKTIKWTPAFRENDEHGVGVVDEVEDGEAHVVPDQVVALVNEVVAALAEHCNVPRLVCVCPTDFLLPSCQNGRPRLSEKNFTSSIPGNRDALWG